MQNFGFKRYLIGISYDGRNFYGFQEQRGHGVKTVEGTLKKALKPYLFEKPSWINLSRTDKGVSARINYIVANFKKELNKDIIKEINETLEEEGIKIIHFERVPLNFTLRGTAKFKEYRYFLPKKGEVWVFNGEKNLKKDFSELNLDLNKFEELKALFLGEKNVINFSKYDSSKNYQYKTKFLDLRLINDEKEEKLIFIVKGDKFYWEEVRRLINIFISYLSGYLDREKLLEMFKEKKEKKAKAYPPEYLVLWDVEFDL
jgi:tRNA pseudouridine38-40 synthase